MKLNKIINLGKIFVAGTRYPQNVFCTVVISDEDNLSIAGVIGPKRGGRCAGSCGQILDDLDGLMPGKGWTQEMVDEFLAIWHKWHLNDLHAGTPRQEAFLQEHFERGRSVGYEARCDALKEAGLLDDNEHLVDGKPYRYGSSWLRQELPGEVIGFLRGLPVADKAPAWA